MKHDTIAVIDFGGQYAHLIATKVRRLHVYAEIRQPEDPIEMFRGYKGLIISGSPSFSAFGEDSGYTKAIYDLPVPIIGFCFGHQEIAKHYGGTIVHGGKEWGHTELHVCADSPVFKGLGRTEQVWMSHFDTVTGIGPDFEEIGWSQLGEGGDVHRFAAIASDKLKRYGFQFHPEVDDTVNGETMIRNFVLDICACRPTWTMGNYVEEQVRRIREQVGNDSVFLLASGGIDSTVCAVLLGRALGPERLHLLHVDNGLMRKDESRAVIERFMQMGLGRNLHFVDASEDFLNALKGLVEPEKKRLAIGNTFIAVFEREARALGIAGHLLGQGTIYPDTIETGATKRSDTIKTHHNRVPLVEEMIRKGRVIEPLADLYKVEVRELGELLGLDRDLVWKHPFPGPGLGVRLLCSTGAADAAEFERMVPEVKAAAAKFGIEAEVLPIRSVGVKADLRAYEHPVLLSADRPWEKIVEAAGTIFRDVYGINRCVWNLAGGTPKLFEPLAATVTRERLDLLREADALVMEGLRRHNVYDEIWQCPTVLVPLRIDGRGREMVIVRPIHSERAMTARPARLPDALIADLEREILALPGVSGLGLDVTSKPPGTIEWE
ncbi:MAG: glutamine-hydrolyzing GMP synthase [Candidatus Aminicenantales bacterium]|jgi:GMP synthase (glutamine-hydrolysing)